MISVIFMLPGPTGCFIFVNPICLAEKNLCTHKHAMQPPTHTYTHTCKGMFLRVRAVSLECRGHLEGSECQFYVSTTEELLCYSEWTLWMVSSRREGERWWEAGKKKKTRDMKKSGRIWGERGEERIWAFMFSHSSMIEILIMCSVNRGCNMLCVKM